MVRVWGSEGFHQRVKRMADSLAGVVLAAGAGRRLAPLTWGWPKALCPVGLRPLVDHALDRIGPHVGEVAVNLHHSASALDAHLPAWVVRSCEEPEALGTAGALGALRPWIDGRAVLVTNSDGWFADLDLSAFVSDWDGERVRLLCVRDRSSGDFGDLRYCGVAVLPWRRVEPLRAVPSGLYEVSWKDHWERGGLDLVIHEGAFVDCGTPLDYLQANLASAGGRSVVDPSALVAPGASVERSVLWPGAVVRPGEVLFQTVRTRSRTVLIRGDLGPTENR